jgi:putative sigma-54 modulation protein
MIYTEQLDGIKLDVQTVDLTIDDEAQEHIREMIRKLSRFISEINFVDVHFKEESSQTNDNRSVSVRVGIPGNDAFASVSGTEWITLLDQVEEKLKRQLTKRKK